MSLELPEINKNGEHLSAEEAIAMQADLIRRSGEDPAKWIDEETERFRAIIDADPGLAELYRRDPQAAEEIIEERLETKKTLH